MLVRRLLRGLAVAASAALLAAAFPPMDASWLVFVALVPLFVVLTGAKPRAAAGYGFGFGLALALGVAGWLPAMIMDFFDLPPLAAWLAFVGLATLVMGVPHALFGTALSLLARRAPVSPWLVAVAFGALELARARVGIANPWALLAYTQPEGSALLQIADVAGPYGIGMLIVSVNALVAGLFAPALRPARPARTAALVLAAVVAALVYGEARRAEDPDARGVDAASPSSRSFRVALVQSQDDPRVLRDGTRDVAGLERKLALTARAAGAEPALVVWPELALGFSLRDESPESARLLASAAATHADWLVGGPDEQVSAAHTNRTNSVFLVHRGQVAARYDKARLMPFAEASPLPAWLRSGGERFAAGGAARTRPLRARAARLGIVLCSEAMHPAYVRDRVAQGADVLVNPSYDAWFFEPGAVAQQTRMAALRAIENHRMLLRAASGGRSAVIDERGRIVAALPSGASDVLVALAHPATGTTVYQRIGDTGACLAAGVTALALLRAMTSARRSAKDLT